VTNLDPAAAAAQLTPEEQLDLLERELAQRKAKRERREVAEAQQQAAQGGPCSRCGATESWERPGVGGWAGGDALGAICWPCKRDLERAGDDSGHRLAVCDRLLGDLAPPTWASVVPGAPTVAARWEARYKVAAMRWWAETLGAPPARGAERFAYTSAEELRDRLYREALALRERARASLRSRGRRFRCPGCQAKGEPWQVTQVGVSAPLTIDGELSRVARAHFRVTWRCTRCGHEDIEERTDQLNGVPVAGLVG
jgi:hypothetical protein